MKVDLIPMEERDIEAMVETERSVFTVPWTAGMFRQELSNALAYYRVAKINGAVVGHGGLWTVFDEGHITNIAVRPAYQRSGIASQILEHFLGLAEEYEMRFLTLEVRESNLPAQALYRKYGFQMVGRRKQYYEDNLEDALIMTRFLYPEGEEGLDGSENIGD